MQRTCGWGVWHTFKNYWRWDLSKTVSTALCHGKTTELYYITVVPAGPADIYIYCSCFHFPPNGDVDAVLDRSQRQQFLKSARRPAKMYAACAFQVITVTSKTHAAYMCLGRLWFALPCRGQEMMYTWCLQSGAALLDLLHTYSAKFFGKNNA